MQLHDFVEWTPAGATLLCIWFLKRFVEETDKFKKETKEEILKLSNSSFDIKEKAIEIKLSHVKLQEEIKYLNFTNHQLSDDTKNLGTQIKELNSFSHKSLEFMKHLKVKTDDHEKKLESIKVKLSEDLTMLKTKKKD